MLTAHDITQGMLRRERALEEAQSELDARAADLPVADREYKVEWAKAYMAAEGSVEARKAVADVATASQRFELKKAETLFKSAQENVRNKRQIVNSGQTTASLVKTEMELAR